MVIICCLFYCLFFFLKCCFYEIKGLVCFVYYLSFEFRVEFGMWIVVNELVKTRRGFFYFVWKIC